MFFRKREKRPIIVTNIYHLGDYVDFFYKDDLYFGHISKINLDESNNVIYDIDIAGQCPTTITDVSESKIVRIHKEK